MSDLQLLFLVLVALYGWECAWWSCRGSVGFRTWLGQWFAPVHPSRLLGNARGGFIFAHPLPPLGTLLLTHQLPISLSGEAVLSFVASSANPGSRPPQAGKLYPFDQIKTITADAKKVIINGEIFLRAATAGLATHIANVLRNLKALPPANRIQAIQKIVHDSLDTKAIEERYREFHTATRWLRVTANALFLYLFLLVPAAIWRFGLLTSWAWLLAGLLAGTTTLAILFHRVHKHFYAASEEERFTHSLIILLSPATAMRAADLISRRLLETFHPVAAAKVLCAEGEFRAVATHYLRELRHPALPLGPQREPVALDTEQVMRSLLQKEVEQVIKKAGLHPSALLSSPKRMDNSCRSYCPRCLAQFTTETGSCEDCGGIPLAAFEAKAEVEKE